MKYPDYAIKTMKEERERLDKSFSRVWAALSPSQERDSIMWHILTAKRKLNTLIEEQEESPDAS